MQVEACYNEEWHKAELKQVHKGLFKIQYGDGSVELRVSVDRLRPCATVLSGSEGGEEEQDDDLEDMESDIEENGERKRKHVPETKTATTALGTETRVDKPAPPKCKKQNVGEDPVKFRFSLTFGENWCQTAGREKKPDQRRVEFMSKNPGLEGGFSNDNLREVMERVTKAGFNCQIVQLEDSVPQEFRERDGFEKAHVLVIRDGARYCGCDAGKMLAEQLRPDVYDTKEYDHRFKNRACKGAINLHARLKTVFEERTERLEHSADYTQPSVNAFREFPELHKLKNALAAKLSDKCRHLNCDGNKYHHAGKG
jgi:hypothetical protein